MMAKYDKYKDSGIEWLGDIPKHWELKRFRYCFKNGKGLSITKENLIDEGVPCVSYGEIHSKYGFEVDPDKDTLACVSEKYLESNESSLLFKGDFIFADTSEDIEGAGNFTHLCSSKNVFAGYHTVISRISIRAYPKYVAYVFDSLAYRTQIRRKVQGVKVYSITNKILKDTILWFPESQEQTAIANYLDKKTAKIDRLINNKKAQIERLKEIRQIEINNAVTKGLNPSAKLKPSGIEWLRDIPEHWEVKRLKQIVATKITDGPHTTPDFVDDGVPFISAQAINHNRINFDDMRGFITKELDEEYSKKVKPQRNDIFIVKSGATTGRIACVETDLDFNIWSPLALVRSNPNKVFYRYLFIQLQSHLFKTQIEIGWSFGTQENIGMGVIECLFIALPPIKEQVAIADYLDQKVLKIDQLVNNIDLQIEQLQEIRKIEIYNAVTGKIKVA
jgi:type I restriction enzyme S subunit